VCALFHAVTQKTAYYINLCYALKLFEMTLLQVRIRWPLIPFPQSFLKEWKGELEGNRSREGKRRGEGGKELGSRIFTLVSRIVEHSASKR